MQERRWPGTGRSQSDVPLVPVALGYPTEELERGAAEGWVVLGGCIVYGDERDPRWACRACAHQWR